MRDSQSGNWNVYDTYSQLILNTTGIEEGSDFGPQLPPWPGAKLKVSTKIALYDLKGKALFLKCLEVLTRDVTSHEGLHPWDDLAETLVTEFFHLTENSGAEEYLILRKDKLYPPLVLDIILNTEGVYSLIPVDLGLPWWRFRIEIHSEPIRFILIDSEICIRTHRSQSKKSFQSR